MKSCISNFACARSSGFVFPPVAGKRKAVIAGVWLLVSLVGIPAAVASGQPSLHHPLDLDRDRDHPRDLDRDRDHPLDLDRDRDHPLDLDRDRDHPLDLDLGNAFHKYRVTLVQSTGTKGPRLRFFHLVKQTLYG